jgi:hypothetical protein
MNRETPTVQSERGLSQTAARMLARALNLLRRVAWRSAASWDNSRSGAKAGSWPVSRSKRNKGLPMNRPERRSPIRRVGVRPQDRAGSETGAPIARFIGGGLVTKEQATFYEPIMVQRNTSPRPSLAERKARSPAWQEDLRRDG